MITESGLGRHAEVSNRIKALSASDIASALRPELPPHQAEVAIAMTGEVSKELDHLMQLATREFRERGSINLGWGRSQSFDAAAMKVGPRHDYLITISVGAPLTLLAMAHEIWAMSTDEPPESLSEEAILNGAMRTGEIGQQAQLVAKDATLLLYFHELSHVLWSHCLLDWELMPSQDRRALEYQADFHAGLSFAAWHIAGIAQPVESDWHAAAGRLVSAALLLATALKAFSAQSDAYHFPTIRMLAFMAGGFQAIQQKSQTFTTQAVFQDPAAEQIFIRPFIAEYLELLEVTELGRLSGTEAEIRADIQQLHAVTTPRLAQLRKDTGSLWDKLPDVAGDADNSD
jgi:hypothetical protein